MSASQASSLEKPSRVWQHLWWDHFFCNHYSHYLGILYFILESIVPLFFYFLSLFTCLFFFLSLSLSLWVFTISYLQLCAFVCPTLCCVSEKSVKRRFLKARKPSVEDIQPRGSPAEGIHQPRSLRSPIVNQPPSLSLSDFLHSSSFPTGR